MRPSPFAEVLVRQVKDAAARAECWTQDDDPGKLERRSKRLTRRLLRYIAELERAAHPGGGPQ